MVLQDFELHGRRIPAGSTLHLILMAAARDESVIPLHERGLMFEALSRAQLAKTFRPERWVVEAAKAPVRHWSPRWCPLLGMLACRLCEVWDCADPVTCHERMSGDLHRVPAAQKAPSYNKSSTTHP